MLQSVPFLVLDVIPRMGKLLRVLSQETEALLLRTLRRDLESSRNI